MLQHLTLTLAYSLLLAEGQSSSDWAPTGPFFQLDAEWDDYIEQIQQVYDEDKPLTPTTEKKPTTADDKDKGYDWALMALGEVPFLAILYQPTASEPNLTEVRPKKTCGGIVVSPDTIVTPCGCIMTFVNHVADEKFIRRKRPDGDFPYDMDAVDSTFSFNNLGVNRIYVVFSQAEFEGSNKDHYLDEDVHDFTASQECYIKTDPFWVDRGQPKKLDSRKIDATLAFWKLVPPITHPVPGQFMPWPPKPITDLETLYNSTDKQEKVIVSGMGFSLKDKSLSSKIVDDDGNPVNFLKQGVNIIFEHCYVISTECPHEFKKDPNTCFCALYKEEYELCGGTIGWPVVDKNNSVVGLTATRRNCGRYHGSILVAVFHRILADDIASAAGSWALLEAQNSKRPPLYREDPWMNRRISLFDYSDQVSTGERNIEGHSNHAYLKSAVPASTFLISLFFTTG